MHPTYTLDPQASMEADKAAFYALKPTLDTMPISKVRLDLGECIKAGFLLQHAVSRPEVQASLDRLHPEHLDPVRRSQLPLATRALLYVKTRKQTARVQTTRALLPAATAAEAKALLERQKKLATYYLRDQEPQKELNDIGKKNGYKNMAYDLTRLNRLIKANQALMQHDTVYFRQEDLLRGPELALEMLQALNRPKNHIWADYAARLFDLFSTCYSEVQKSAAFVMRHTSLANDFPTLYSVARKTKRPKNPRNMSAKSHGHQNGPPPVSKPAKQTHPQKT